MLNIQLFLKLPLNGNAAEEECKYVLKLYKVITSVTLQATERKQTNPKNITIGYEIK